jgi:hypothetical protein
VWSASQPQKLGAKMRLIWNKDINIPISAAENASDFKYNPQYGTNAPTKK